MKNLFGIDSPIFRFLGRLSDMIILNILWLVCCLPVFTIGASTTALYQCTEKMIKDKEIVVGHTFFKSFKAEFKQSTSLCVIVFLVFAVMIADAFIVFLSDFGSILAGRVSMIILIALIYPALCYVFPLQAHFENKVLRTLKNAWLMSISHYPISLLVAVLHLLPFALFYFFPAAFFQSLIMWILIGGSLIAHFSSRLLHKVFKKYETT